MDYVAGIAAWSVSTEVGGHSIEAAELMSREVEQLQVVVPRFVVQQNASSALD